MGLAHREIVTYALLASREVARCMVQACFDLRAQQKRLSSQPKMVALDAVSCAQGCNLDTVVGRVGVLRWAWQCTGAPAVRPMDAAIDLPREVNSSGVRRFVCEQFADHPVTHRCEALDKLGIEVPRRQAEQLAVRMAQDFDAFYAERERPANDTVTDKTLLVLSNDAKGVRMLPRALREATRKAAARDAINDVRGDQMAARSEHAHDRRMAVVTAIWDQEPCMREAADIIEQLKPPA